MKITAVRTTPVRGTSAHAAAHRFGQHRAVSAGPDRVGHRCGCARPAYALAYLPELLGALERTVAGLGEMLLGRPLNPRDLHEFLRRRCRLLGVKGLAGMALGALDMAAWDAWARSRGELLARALGAELRPLRAYNSVGLYAAAE